LQERLGILLGLTPSAAALLILFLLQLPQALLCLACSAWAARRRLLLHRQIESFSLQSRECFDEADRPLVEDCVERLWSGCGAHKGRACGGGEVPPLRAAPAASTGIQAFNSYVRRVLSRVVERRIGAMRSLPYADLVLSSSWAALYSLDVATGLYRHGGGPVNPQPTALRALFACFAITLISYPLLQLCLWNVGACVARLMAHDDAHDAAGRGGGGAEGVCAWAGGWSRLGRLGLLSVAAAGTLLAASASVLYQALHIRLLSGRLGAGVVAVDVGLGWLLWRWGSFSEGGGAGQEGPGNPTKRRCEHIGAFGTM